jgi:hypothetical protein
VAAYPRAPRAALDPTLDDANRRLRRALLAAIGEHAEGWSDDERAMAAAAIDVAWSVDAHERLVTDWELDGDQAIRAATWMIGLVERAVREGDRPA